MPDSFEKSFKMVIEHEGHYSNDPADRGGATCWGITHSEINKFLGHTATIDEVKNFPINSAKQIYKEKYWNAMKLDMIKSEIMRLLLFDQGVNRGCGTAIISIEKVLGIAVNGIMDEQTIHSINHRNPIKLGLDFVKEAQKAYISIAIRNPSQIVFLSGWINRTHKLLDMIYFGVS